MIVNFKKEHFDRMVQLATIMLLSNGVIMSKLGQPMNIVELLHTTTIGTLNNIRVSLGKYIEGLENQDEWVATTESQKKLEVAKEQKELVNLIIGYKRHKAEVEETSHKRAILESQLKSLKESQKTPEDKIKELEAELNGLTTEEF